MAVVDRVHLHIKNNRAGEEIFRITPQRLSDARERHGDVGPKLTTTIDWDVDNFESHIATAHGLITWDLPTRDLAARAPNLQWIHIIGAGVEHLRPLDWLPDGVLLTNNRGVHSVKAGEYGLMALLMLSNRIPELVTAQRRHDYVERYTTSIAGSNLLVIGAGHMGSAIAARASALGMSVTGIRRGAKPTEGFDVVHGPEELDLLLPHADFVLVTAPLTPETHGLLDSRRLGLMKPGVGLINMGRAAIVEEIALIDALESGHVSGAVIDVFDPEPLPSDSPLWDTPRLIMTPHMSSDDRVWYTPLTLDLVFDNARRLLAGEALLNVVDLDRGY